MELFESVPVEAVQLTPDNIREVAEWLVPPPGKSGYSWYEGSPARLRTVSGELAAEMGGWIVQLGPNFVSFTAPEFSQLFTPAHQGDSPAR